MRFCVHLTASIHNEYLLFYFASKSHCRGCSKEKTTCTKIEKYFKTLIMHDYKCVHVQLPGVASLSEKVQHPCPKKYGIQVTGR